MDNTDIGIRPGPRSAKQLVLNEARRMWEGDDDTPPWSGTKKDLCEHLSEWLGQQYAADDPLAEPFHMCPERIGRLITPLRRELRPEQTGGRPKQKI